MAHGFRRGKQARRGNRECVGVALFSKAILGLFGNPASRESNGDKAGTTPASTAHQAYSKAGRVVQKQGKPVLTTPVSTTEAASGMGDIPEPVMQEMPAATGSTDSGTTTSSGKTVQRRAGSPALRPMTPERRDLIQKALVIHRAKQGILADLSPEQRARLMLMATQAFRLDHKDQKKT